MPSERRDEKVGIKEREDICDNGHVGYIMQLIFECLERYHFLTKFIGMYISYIAFGCKIFSAYVE
jgi:hypothetical protein